MSLHAGVGVGVCDAACRNPKADSAAAPLMPLGESDRQTRRSPVIKFRTVYSTAHPSEHRAFHPFVPSAAEPASQTSRCPIPPSAFLCARACVHRYIHTFASTHICMYAHLTDRSNTRPPPDVPILSCLCHSLCKQKTALVCFSVEQRQDLLLVETNLVVQSTTGLQGHQGGTTMVPHLYHGSTIWYPRDTTSVSP